MTDDDAEGVIETDDELVIDALVDFEADELDVGEILAEADDEAVIETDDEIVTDGLIEIVILCEFEGVGYAEILGEIVFVKV